MSVQIYILKKLKKICRGTVREGVSLSEQLSSTAYLLLGQKALLTALPNEKDNDNNKDLRFVEDFGPKFYIIFFNGSFIFYFIFLTVIFFYSWTSKDVRAKEFT
jgi:hypothetical protein